MPGLGKKGPSFVPAKYVCCLDQLSKAALIDIAWNLALFQAGNGDAEDAFSTIAFEADIVTRARGDRLPKAIVELAEAEWELMMNPRARSASD